MLALLLTAAVVGQLPTWKQVDALVAEDKYEAAAKAAEQRLAAARRSGGDEAELARALVRLTQLRIGLGGYETAVKRLRDEAWPKGLVPRTAVQLFYAGALAAYLEGYSWEIAKRETVDTRGQLDLKRWTADQILAEAEATYEAIWKRRAELGAVPVTALDRTFLEPNTFPRGIRDTLRDAVTYLRVRHLADSQWWSPDASNGTWQLDLPALIAGELGAARRVNLIDAQVHPLVRIGAMLTDLEEWHRTAGRKEAALYARHERLDVLRAHFTSDEERGALARELEASLTAAAALPFSAWARGSLASWIAEGGDVARARDVALVGARAFPGSFGGARCQGLVARWEAPAYLLHTMASDGPGKRSLEVRAKNLPRLFLRAWRLDVDRVLTTQSYSPLPSGDDLRGVLTRRADAAWAVDLPATPDLVEHRTFVTPPLSSPGLYVIAGSAREDFADTGNRIIGMPMFVSNLVLTLKQVAQGAGLEVTVRDGATGAPVADAEVVLYGGSWNVPRKALETRRTGADGLATFKAGRSAELAYVVAARRGADVVVDDQALNFWAPAPARVDTALLYTDRAIYRPGQQLLWKLVAYRGVREDGKFEVVPNVAVPVRLLDANSQEVAKATVTTNTFGSASGSFTVPAGRLLGSWRIEARGARSFVRVEEYKRPTFEVSFREPGAALALNAPVSLAGEARYAFGLPVPSGRVRWRATRTPVYPWWWWGRATARPQVVGSGTTAIGADGSFALGFTPTADPKLAKDVSYRYLIEADVTDDGGETRSASTTLRLGLISVQASFDVARGFFRQGQPVELGVRRTDLNGVGRAGAGRWRLLALRQPATALLPAEEAPVPPPGVRAPALQTPGDALRPRWEQSYDPAVTLRGWADGPERAHGELTHDAAGQATLTLPDVPPGAWRLRYETEDERGATWAMATELLVAGREGVPMLPAIARVEEAQVRVGGTVRLWVASAFAGQPLQLEVLRAGRVVERRWLTAGKDAPLVERVVGPEDRGGFTVQVSAVRDWQLMTFAQAVRVPWEDRELAVEFSTFRDRVRPGAKETFTVRVTGKGPALERGAAEVLAYMYDQSLDLFGAQVPPSVLGLYPDRTGAPYVRSTLGSQGGQWLSRSEWYTLPTWAEGVGDQLTGLSGYAVGGMGRRTRTLALKSVGARVESFKGDDGELHEKQAEASYGERRRDAPPEPGGRPAEASSAAPASVEGAAPPLRQNFAETAFFLPHLLLDPSGSVSFQFEVPDSVTAWNVWAHALTRDLRGGSVKKETRSVKELMVRPYVPRFLREGDQAVLKVLVNNASGRDLSGELVLDVIDPSTQKSVLAEFGVASAAPRPFSARAGQGATLTFPLTAPRRVGEVAVKVVARAGDLSDGELRGVPLLPSRLHLAQSRFVTLKGADSRTMRFADLAKTDDPSRLDEQLVVTIDAQLFSSVLAALPYLVRYPYECTEQTLNRFLSTGIVASVYRDHPAVAKLGAKLAARQTRLEPFDAADPNRSLALEEAPWLLEARGDPREGEELVSMLEPRALEAERATALSKLARLQQPSGAFPWFAGGPPSPYMTLYLLHGLARAVEFRIDVPKPMAQRAWRSVGEEYRRDYSRCLDRKDCSWEFVTLINYVASAFPDESWLGGALSAEERARMLAFSFKHWREHSPLLKGYLALTLTRAGRAADAKLVFDSVMDSAKTTPDDGTFWRPEDRAWLWYNDTIEAHAFALRVLTELAPKDARRAGLVQWLLLNKKLGHWKSTRATAEVLYALVKHLAAEQELGVREESTVAVGPLRRTFVFEPDEYTGRKNQLVVPGAELDPRTMASVTVSKTTPGLQFASATWHFSTERLPEQGRGDFFGVTRTYFKRVKQGPQVTLRPLVEGARLEPGDELEVQLSIRARQAAEYVHLRDPRGAGFEPEAAVSRYRWDLGLGWYEEYRDSGTNFFFDRLPPGEYTLRYRVRASMGGQFRVGPATLQSMYAPEFTAYSAGARLGVATGGQ